MPDILVFYATTEGQTRRIADHLASKLRLAGLTSATIDVSNTDQVPLDWQNARGAVIGASLHLGRYQRAAARFARAHHDELNAVPSAFFGVSLSAASQNASEAAAAQTLAQNFVDSCGWRPRRVASFAGRLAYSQYGFLKRLLMGFIASREGGPTDVSRDHELTDWDAVDRFARAIADDVLDVSRSRWRGATKRLTVNKECSSLAR